MMHGPMNIKFVLGMRYAYCYLAGPSPSS